MNISQLAKWVHAKAKEFGVWILSFLVTVTFAAELSTSPTALAPRDVSTLAATITASATSLTLEPVHKWVNGTETTGCFDTTAGFILIEDFGGKSEYASYGSKSCSSSFITTLSELRRGLSVTSSSYTAGTGQAFDAGASVRVVDYPTIYNKNFHVDTGNVCTASGCVSYSGSGSEVQAVFATEAARTQQYGSNPRIGAVSCLDSTGQCYDYMAGAWRSRSGSNIINATTTAAGKGILAVVADILAHNVYEGGSPLIVWTDLVTRSGSGASNNENKIVATSRNGVISGCLLGKYNGDCKAINMNAVWMGSGLTVRSFGSGVTMIVNSNYQTVSHLISGTTFKAMGSGTITGTGTNIAIGDLLDIRFNLDVETTVGTNVNVYFDISVNGTRLGTTYGGTNGNTNGLQRVFFPSTGQVQPVTLHYLYQSTLGGTLTIQPMWKTGGASEEARLNISGVPVYIQIKKAH